MFLLSMALVEGLIKALKSVTLYQCLAALAASRATSLLPGFNQGPRCLSLRLGDSGIIQKKCLWITSILLTEIESIYIWAAAPHEDFWIKALAHEKIKARCTSTKRINTQSSK